jgi:hypothetical protein
MIENILNYLKKDKRFREQGFLDFFNGFERN